MDLSNKSLALLLVSAIVISLGGTIISLNKLNPEATGFAVSPLGNVSLIIGDLVDCRVDLNVTFGTASNVVTAVNITTNTTNSYGTTDCSAAVSCGMLINNTGNKDLAVNFTSNVNATTMIGGPNVNNAHFQYATFNGTNTGTEYGCTSGLNYTWRYVNESNAIICLNFSYLDTQDMMHIEYNLTIDQNTPPGAKSARITITCEQA